MENSTLLTEKPIQGRAAPDNTRGGSGITRPKDEFFKKDKNFIRNVISGMNQKAFRKEGVGTFDKLVTAIKGSTSASPLKKAKCLKIAGKIRGMSTCEEVSRRNKPSNIKKKKSLDVALEKLKKKREEVKEGSSIIYVGKKRQYHGPTGDHKRDKEGNIVASHYKKKPSPTGEKYGDKSGRPKTPKPADVRARRKKTDTTRSALNRAKKFEREKARVNQGDAKRRSSGTGEYAKGFSEDFEGVLRKDDPARRTPGKTITTTAKTTGYEKGDLPASKKKKQLPQSTNSAIVKTDKKSTVITREKGGPITQKQNPRVGQPDGPDDKRTKRGERKLKAISRLDRKRTQNIKKRLDKTKDAAGNVAQGLVANRKAVGDLGGAYGTSTFKENIKSNWRSELAEDAYAAKQGGGLWLLDKGLEGAANIVKFGSTIFNMAKKRKESPGQMRLPGFQGAKKKETSWGHSKNAHKDAIDKWRKDNGLPPDSKALPPWAGK